MSEKPKCEACRVNILRGELLRCTLCHDTYHYRCLNMENIYYEEKKNFLQNSWRCLKCLNITRQIRDDNTPVRSQHQRTFNETTMSIDDQVCEDHSLTGDTPPSPHTPMNFREIERDRSQLNSDTGHITLSQLSQLLDTKLDEKLEKNKLSILNELQNTFQTEIQRIEHKIDTKITTNYNNLNSRQDKLANMVTTVEEKIHMLEVENTKLRQELQELHKEINNTHQNYTDMTKNVETKTEENSKKLVIYGLHEHHGENEYDLERRIEHAFRNILGIDLTGYIEEVIRIGRRGPRRPVMLELVTKKMTKYILKNKGCFKSTGLFVSEFLERKALQDRRRQREEVHQTKSVNNTQLTQRPSIVNITSRTSSLPSQEKSRQCRSEEEQNTNDTFRF